MFSNIMKKINKNSNVMYDMHINIIIMILFPDCSPDMTENNPKNN